MRRLGKRRRRASVAGIALGLTVLAGCGTNGDHAKGGAAPHDGQGAYVDLITDARKQLVKGRITFTDLPAKGEPGEPIHFRAEISGSDLKPTAPPTGPPEKEETTSVGARVGLTLNCSGADAKCTSHSTEKQNVLTASDRAVWRWTVEPKKEGRLTVSLSATSYYRETDNALTVEDTEAQKMTVEYGVAEEARKGASDLGNWLIGFFGALGGVGTAVALVRSFRRRLARRRTTDQRADENTNSPV